MHKKDVIPKRKRGTPQISEFPQKNLIEFSVLPGYPGVLVLVLHQQPAPVRDLTTVRQRVSSVGYTQLLPVRVRRCADVAVAAADADGSAAFAAGALKAVAWAKGRAPGIYTMQDVLKLG